MVFEKFSKTDLKFTALAFLLGGLAYVFTDVAVSGVINMYSVIAYMVVLITVMVFGPIASRRFN